VLNGYVIAVCAIVLQHGWLLLLLLRLFIYLCCWAFVRVSWLLLPAVVSRKLAAAASSAAVALY
jgi:hypothetical protein